MGRRSSPLLPSRSRAIKRQRSRGRPSPTVLVLLSALCFVLILLAIIITAWVLQLRSLAAVHSTSSPQKKTKVTAGKSSATEVSNLTAGHSHVPDESADDEDDESARRQAAAQSLVATWRSSLSRIVLILNFKSPDAAWKGVDFWRAIYGRLFDNVVVVSTEAVPELGVQAASFLTGKDPSLRPSLAYSVLPELLARFVDAEGFLWLEADAVLNYWTLIQADKTRIWFSQPSDDSVKHLIFGETQEDDASVKHLKELAKNSLHAIPESFRDQHENSLWPAKSVFLSCASKAFYIPQKFSSDVALHLLPRFAEVNLPHETAIPMALLSLGHPSSFDTKALRTFTNLSGKECEMKQKCYNTTVALAWPWEAVSSIEKQNILQSMGQADLLLLSMSNQS